MSEKTGIAWTDHTFNPWWGCVKVSPACTHCYAETLATRYGHPVWGTEAPRRFFGDKHWDEPLRWNTQAERDGIRRRVFCASMADVFEDREGLCSERARLFALIRDTPQLDWLLLTKRPENILRLWPESARAPGWRRWPNVWLGTTAENQQYADERIPALLRVPARFHFLSYEPALGPLNLQPWLCASGVDALHWVIAGGESGAGFRAADPEWFRSVRDQCKGRARFFFKQWGGLRPKSNGAELDGREWTEVPQPDPGGWGIAVEAAR